MRQYLWVNWSNLEYKTMPYRNGFKNVAGYFEFPIDRFNLLEDKLELPTYSIVKQPKFNLSNLTNDWEDRYYAILDGIADKVYSTAQNKTIVITYSGGIDSACVLVSLQKHPRYKEFLEAGRFKVAMTSSSIDEYPEQFFRDILPNIPIMPLDYCKLMEDPGILLVTGDMGDHVIGSTDVLRFTGGNTSDLDLMLPWRAVLPRIAQIPDSSVYQELLLTLMSKAPFDIQSINQMSWWWANSLDHQDDLLRPWYWSTTTNFKDIATQNKVFRFFYDNDMMTFSFEYMSTNPEYHHYIDNKLWPKKYVVNATGDQNYMQKQKVFSQRMSLRHTFKTQIYIEDNSIGFESGKAMLYGPAQN